MPSMPALVALTADAADAADAVLAELIPDDFAISGACCVLSLTRLQGRAKQY